MVHTSTVPWPCCTLLPLVSSEGDVEVSLTGGGQDLTAGGHAVVGEHHTGGPHQHMSTIPG